MPSSTLSKQNCFVQLAQGFWSNVGISKTVEFEPQKHLQNIFISAASAIEMNNDINTNNIFFCLLKKKRRKKERVQIPIEEEEKKQGRF